MNLRKLGVDSMAVAVAFGMGIGLGYVACWVELDALRQEALNRGFYRNGQWASPVDFNWTGIK